MNELEERALALTAALLAGRSGELPLANQQQADASAHAAVFIYTRVLTHLKNAPDLP